MVLSTSLACLSFSASEVLEKRYYSIREGKARDTLKLVAAQARVDLIVMSNVTKGVRTPSIKGRYHVDEAFEQLLMSTPLAVVYHDDTDAYAVVRRSAITNSPESDKTRSSENQTNPESDPEMSEIKRLLKQLTRTAAATAVVAGAPIARAQNAAPDDEVYELSPFTLNADEDDGYRATSTLAGSRIKIPLRDIGTSIAVVTKEMMEDLGTTDGSTMLNYVGNTEVGGAEGNFADPSFSGDRTDASGSRLDPQSSQRIRGLVSAALTRDYFRTIIPFDSYNTTRVEVNRGPNSILFGLGTPGGVINNSLKGAYMNDDTTSFSVRFDHRGGHRETLDLNRVLIPERLALRVSLLNANRRYKQEPAESRDERMFFAWNSVLRKNEEGSWFGRTQFRGSFEKGSNERTPPDTLPPADAISTWFRGYNDPVSILRVPGYNIDSLRKSLLTQQDVRDAVAAGLADVPEGQSLDEFAAEYGQFIPNTLVDRFTGEGLANTGSSSVVNISPEYQFDSATADVGWTTPGLENIDGIVARWRPNNGPGGSQIRRDRRWGSNSVQGLPGFSVESIQDRTVFDYHNHLITGHNDQVEDDFELSQFVLDQQLFGGKAGIELAFDRQERDRFSFLPAPNRFRRDLHIDIDKWLPVSDTDRDDIGDSFPNNNAGRPVFRYVQMEPRTQLHEQEVFRATVFADVDLRDYSNDWLGKVLGRHTITGLHEERTNDFSTRISRIVNDNVIGPDLNDRDILNGTHTSARHHVKTSTYLGPSVFDTGDLSKPTITGTADTDLLGLIGRDIKVIYFDNSSDIDGPVEGDWFIRDYLHDGNLSREKLDSRAASLQSRFFEDHIITLFAVRKDRFQDYERIDHAESFPIGSPERDSAPSLRLADGSFNAEELMFLKDESRSDIEGTTHTFSVVGDFPEKIFGNRFEAMDLRGHYYRAESFQPGTGNNVLNQGLASPSGDTEEYGVTMEFLNRKLSLRVNAFETTSSDTRTGVSGAVGQLISRVQFFLSGAIEAQEQEVDIMDTNAPELLGVSTYEEWYAKIIDILPDEVQDVYDLRIDQVPNPSDPGAFNLVPTRNAIDGATSTFDFVAKGIEVDLIGKVTPNWNVSLNIAQQETVQSNTAPILSQVAFGIEQSIIDGGYADVKVTPARGDNNTYLGNYLGGVTLPLRAELAKDGTASLEQREWRVNFVSGYTFLEGSLEGLTVGGALRWQDKVAVGYPFLLDEVGNQIPDINNAYFGPDQMNGDLFFRYRRPLTLLNREMEWSIQINARNAYRSSGTDDIPVVINPNGEIAVVRIPNERHFFVTNTFSF